VAKSIEKNHAGRPLLKLVDKSGSGVKT